MNRSGAAILTWTEGPGVERGDRHMAAYKPADGTRVPHAHPSARHRRPAGPRRSTRRATPGRDAGLPSGYGDGRWAVPVTAAGAGTLERIVDYSFCAGSADYDASGSLYVIWNVSSTRCDGQLRCSRPRGPRAARSPARRRRWRPT